MARRRAGDRQHRVLLVREWDSQHGSSGCCGRLGGVDTELGRPEDFAHARTTMVEMGAVYRAVREAFPDVDVTVVDPRNWMWLWPAVYRDARASGLDPWRAARESAAAGGPATVVVDGVVVSAREVPDPGRAVALVADRLARTGSGEGSSAAG